MSTHAIISQMQDLTITATSQTAPVALKMAQRCLKDMQVIQTYDAFTHSVLLGLEDLGFCKKGSGPDFITDTGIGPDGSVMVNTNGGGLSYAHTGMYGAFLVTESIRQLRGTAAAQVKDCEVALLNGHGGLLSSATTLVLEQG